MNSNRNHYLTKKLKINNFYLAMVKFEDGYDNRIGSNKKSRPVLILDKFYDYNEKVSKYIVVPVYSTKKEEFNNDNKFVSKYKYHFHIKKWQDSFNKNMKYYNVKFKINQIQILSKKNFIFEIVNSSYFYKLIKDNSPIDKLQLENFNKLIEEYSLINFKNYETRKIIGFYLRRLEIKKEKLFKKSIKVNKEQEKKYNYEL